MSVSSFNCNSTDEANCLEPKWTMSVERTDVGAKSQYSGQRKKRSEDEACPTRNLLHTLRKSNASDRTPPITILPEKQTMTRLVGNLRLLRMFTRSRHQRLFCLTPEHIITHHFFKIRFNSILCYWKHKIVYGFLILPTRVTWFCFVYLMMLLNLKVTVFGDVALCSFVETGDVRCLLPRSWRRWEDIKNPWNVGKFYETTQCNIPKYSHLHIRCPDRFIFCNKLKGKKSYLDICYYHNTCQKD